MPVACWLAGIWRNAIGPDDPKPRVLLEHGTHDPIFPFEDVAVRNFPSKNIVDLKTVLAEIYESLNSIEPEIEEANKARKAARPKG